MQGALQELFGEVIHTYTRAQAIEDGVLVDVSEMAREAGFKFPVAVTSAVWHEYIVPDKRARSWGQSEEGRLWDVLVVLSYYARQSRGREIRFKVIMVMMALNEKERQEIELKAICGPGDDFESVITIMKPEED